MKKTVLISLNRDTCEIKSLAETLGYEIIKEFIQVRNIPDVNTFIGPGKLEEIKNFLKENKVDLIIVNDRLKPSQWFILEKELKTDVYDRIRTILMVFDKRAESKEARLQVKLAQLQYERPFVRELIHRARKGEHPGYMAGGEYEVADYYEMIKRQMKKIRDELKKIRREREIRRRHRYEIGFYLVSLAGYTNAGKSSLLNILAEENVRVEEKLFSTLSTTTRRITEKTGKGRLPILITDTVGFIKNLPAWVIEAFHSTLEEIEVADLILLVVDISDDTDEIVQKMETSFKELKEMKANSKVLIVLNKIDLLDEKEIKNKVKKLEKLGLLKNNYVLVSTKEKRNIDKLIDMIRKNLPNLVKLRIELPLNKDSQGFLSKLFEIALISGVRYDEKIKIKTEVNYKIKDKIVSSAKKLGGKVKISKV
ncbi:GTPase HflX [Euryarchaeota archaeon ex4484_162]|nr:MAG: GTPase HflX [Euryarchaeota archaeon ex4484_162]